MKLQDYPRPPNDNGMGLHFTLSLREDENHPDISTAIANLKSVNMTWTLIYAPDALQARKAAKMCWDAGIMPVLRPACLIDRPRSPDWWAAFVHALTDQNIPPYIQVFNEPGDDREWKGTYNLGTYVSNWCDVAGWVLETGGMPGIQSLDPSEVTALLNGIQARADADEILDKFWFSLHNYGANHPPDYPYDDVNQNGTPVSGADYARYHFSASQEDVNRFRREGKKPGATIFDDDTSVIRHPTFAKVFQDSVGLVPPFIGGEGGWEYGAENDLRYPKVEGELHAEWHKRLYDSFRTGVMPNPTNNAGLGGEPLPDYLFSMTVWIVGGWGTDDWFGGDPKTLTIHAVQSIPSFTRKFSWDQPTTPTAPVVTPTPVTPPPPPPPAPIFYTIQPGDTLISILIKFGLSQEQLTAANDLSKPENVRPGMTVFIPK